MTRVILLTVDSLRVDRFNRDRFEQSWPFLDRFDRFENAHAHGVATPFAFPGIISGVLPTVDGVLPETATLAEHTPGRAVGYANNPHLRPDRGYDRGFDSFSYLGGRSGEGLLGRVKQLFSENDLIAGLYGRIGGLVGEGGFDGPYRPADRQAERTKEAVRGGATLCWTHFQDPHFPFSPTHVTDRDLADRIELDHAERLLANYAEGRLEPGSEEMASVADLYDANVAYFDRQLASLLEWFDRRGLFDEAIIVLTADHGEVFGERGMINHPWDATPVDALVNVPLAVSVPGGDGGQHRALTSHISLNRALADAIESDVSPDTAEYTTEAVVAKSNAVVRVVGDGGSVYAFRDGSTEVVGNVTDSLVARAERASFPAVPKLSGNRPGTEVEEQALVEERLSDLGYLD